VPEIWVTNASPVITLAKAGGLGLLERVAPELWLPEVVAREILDGPPEDPARRAIESGWGKRISSRPIPGEILEWGLGVGESAVLALTMATDGAVAVLDDATARKSASVLGIPRIGTLGVVVKAKLEGLVPTAAPLIRALRAAGLYIDDRVVQKALSQGAGEQWEP
jgi:hypothetical protein